MPKNFVETEDNTELQDWAESLDADKFFKKLREAKVPSDLVDQLEDAYDEVF